jgi:hypothetical protein
MGYVVGIVLAPLVAVFARVVGLDRDRSFYATVLIVVASYYILFAVMGGSTRALVVESMAMAMFVALAVAGLKRGTWIVAVGLVAHGVFDFVHADIISDPGVPQWWPAFCGTYDVVAGVVLAGLCRSSFSTTSRVSSSHLTA